MSPEVLQPTTLIPCGKILLVGSFGYSLVRSIRESRDLSPSFERLFIGCLMLVVFLPASKVLLDLGEELTKVISRVGQNADLRKLILESFKEAAKEPVNGSSVSLNIPSVLEQAWRTGVWGIMSNAIDWVFMIASFLLECMRDVFWTLLLFLFPIGCGFYPVFPQVMVRMAIYTVELAMWFPMLEAVEVTTAVVAKREMVRSGSWGLHIVAVELVAILLIFMIPSLVHRFLSGTVSGDMDTQSGIMRATRRALKLRTGGVSAKA